MSALPSRPATQVIPLAALVFAGILVGALTMRFATPPPPGPPRVAPLADDSLAGAAPAVSLDGRTVVFESGGLAATPLAGGAVTTLVAGDARLPRFTADGASIVYTRGAGPGAALWIVPVAGGEPRPLLGSAADADPSPDGRWIAFVRTSGDADSVSSAVIVSDSTGEHRREVHREPGEVLHGPRWSPDGRRIAVTVDARSGVPGRVLLIGIGEQTRALALPDGTPGASVGAWVDSKRYVYAVPAAPDARWPVAGSSVRVHHVKRDRSYEGAWWPGEVTSVEALPDGRLVLAGSGAGRGRGLLRVDRVAGLGRPSR